MIDLPESLENLLGTYKKQIADRDATIRHLMGVIEEANAFIEGLEKMGQPLPETLEAYSGVS